MNFDQTDDHRMLSDSLSRVLRDACTIEARNATAYTAPYHNPALWSQLTELGVLHALTDDAHGGFGGTGFDITTVFQALGAALCPEPVLPALMASRLLAHANEDQATLLSGVEHYAVAVGELDSWSLDEIETTAYNGTLTGRKSVVYGGQVADKILVAARNEAQLALYEIATADVEMTVYSMIDGGGAAEIFLNATPARLVLKDAEQALQDTLDAGALALSAEALGAMDVTLDTLIEYLKQRQQFGRSIGSNQVLQHRAVELATEIEQARSIVILAASRMGTDMRSRSVSMCKNLCGRVAIKVAEETIQMHGGIAMTWESPVSHYAKRLVMIDSQLGDSDHHIKRVMAALQAA